MSQPFGGPVPARPAPPLTVPAFQRGRPSQRAEHMRPHPYRVPDPKKVRFLTVAEVAAELRVSKMTVYRLIDGSELDAIRVGRSYRVPTTSFEDYLRTAADAAASSELP